MKGAYMYMVLTLTRDKPCILYWVVSGSRKYPIPPSPPLPPWKVFLVCTPCHLETPYFSFNTFAFATLLPLEISIGLLGGGGGMDIFWKCTTRLTVSNIFPSNQESIGTCSFTRKSPW